MRIAALIVVVIAIPFARFASAELPPPTDEAAAQAAEAAAKAAWSDKTAQYKLCVAMDRTAETYRSRLEAAGKNIPAPVGTPPCTDPGPYVSQVASGTSRPLEAAGAHSPPETAASPPSTAAAAGETSRRAGQ